MDIVVNSLGFNRCFLIPCSVSPISYWNKYTSPSVANSVNERSVD